MLLTVIFTFLAAAAHLTQSKLSIFPPSPRLPRPPLAKLDLIPRGLRDYKTPLEFPQLLDHNHPSLGTFSQRYYFNAEWWSGPGAPIVFFTPGEDSATAYTGYMGNLTLTGTLAKELSGVAVVLEHRYYGQSSPFPNLTTEALQYLTIEQVVADFTYFAENVVFPSATSLPWLFVGGSYSGALAAWTYSTAPGTFWAYHASSALAETIADFWQYFDPIREGMPANCSKDVELVVNYIDEVFEHGTAENVTALKTMFGLESLTHNDDFASVLQNGPWNWQLVQEYTGYSAFFRWCDAVENVEEGAKQVPDENGVGLEKALKGYASWISETTNNSCQMFGYPDANDFSCFDTYNASNLIYTDRSVDNGYNLQWQWLLCNQLGFYQTGAPETRPTIVSRVVTEQYWERQCDLLFPPSERMNAHSNSAWDKKSSVAQATSRTNMYTQGWNLVNTTRLSWANGEFDPWRSAGVSSKFRPGGPLQSTKEAPVELIPDATHCYDMYTPNADMNKCVGAAVGRIIGRMKKWVQEFEPRGPRVTVGMHSM